MDEQKEPKMDSLPSSDPTEKRQEKEENSKQESAPQTAPQEKPAPEKVQDESNEKKKDDDPYWWYLFSKKRVWAAFLCAFLFLYFTGVVPADNVPILRSLARMMGYSEDEAKGISFLKALLDWNEHKKRAQEEKVRAEEDRRKAQQLAENNALQTGKMLPSSLINWDSVNDFLLKQGKQADDLTDVEAEKTRTGGPIPVALTDTKNNADTDANNPANMDDVYFGTVAGGVERNKNDGYDSFKMLSKIANPYQIDSSRHDWLGQAANNAFWAESGVSELLQQVAEQKGGGFIMHSNIREIDDQRARKDMYYAWITSRAGARTRNIWLMKTLASAGFLGADLDRQMLTIGTVGGMSFDEDAVLVDLENVEKRLQFEKECNEALAGDGADITAGMSEINNDLKALNGAFPQTCSDSGDAFRGGLDSIGQRCNQLNEGYTQLQKGCQLQYTKGSCDTSGLVEMVNAFEKACEEEREKCDELKTDEEKQQCRGNVDNMTREEVGKDNVGAPYSEDTLKNILAGTTEVSTDENGHVSGETFLPVTDWQNTLQNIGNIE